MAPLPRFTSGDLVSIGNIVAVGGTGYGGMYPTAEDAARAIIPHVVDLLREYGYTVEKKEEG